MARTKTIRSYIYSLRHALGILDERAAKGELRDRLQEIEDWLGLRLDELTDHRFSKPSK